MRRLHDLWRRGRRAARNATPDSELLERFVRHGDHAAFAELVERFGPLVYGTCRRLLPNPADVEDAFQATFLVLVRRAESLAGRSVGPWLHRVALWTARGFRRRIANATRHAAEHPLPSAPPGLDATDARLDIDAAVSALPEKYRVPIILCHLQGWTRRELAAHLGCPESTASSLVGRGLAKLKKRLAGRDPAMVLAVAGAAALPSGLSALTVRAACLYRTNSLAAAASPAVAALTEGVLRMFRVKKLAAALAAAVAVIGLGFGLAVGTGPRADAQAPRPSQPAAPGDDAKAEREKLEKDIAAAKERLKHLEAQKAQLQYRDLLDQYYDLLSNQKPAPDEPYIGLWVRPQNWPPALGRNLNMDPNTAAQLWGHLAAGGAGPRSEFAINEIYGKGKPVVEVHFYDVRSLQVYLTRAAKDPTAPTKLKLDIDKEYPAAKVRAVLEACKAAGFTTIELVSAPAGSGTPPKSTLPAYVIEAPDVLTIEAILRSGDLTRPLPSQPVSGQFVVRPDGTVGLGLWGSVNVSGLTLDQTSEAVRKHLVGHDLLKEKDARAESVSVVVDVVAYNSKKYYLITEGAEGEQVVSLPCTGSERVLDAIAQVNGLSGRLATSEFSVARPSTQAGQPSQILPVDWAAIKQGNTATNYQLLPGDRLYIKPKK